MMRLTVREQTEHVRDADEGEQRNPLHREVRQGNRGSRGIGGELHFENRHEDVSRSDDRSDGQPETERMPRRPHQNDRRDGHRGPIDQRPRQQVKRIPRKARHHDDHPAERAHPEDRPRKVAAHDRGRARTPTNREAGHVARNCTHGHGTSMMDPTACRCPEDLLQMDCVFPQTTLGQARCRSDSRTRSVLASKGAVMRKATTKRQDHTVTAMDRVGRLQRSDVLRLGEYRDRRRQRS